VTYQTQSLGISNIDTGINYISNQITNNLNNTLKTIIPNLTVSTLTLVNEPPYLDIRKSAKPTSQPSNKPSSSPSSQPSRQPSSPSSLPTSQPSTPIVINNGDINVFISFGALFGFIVLITLMAEYQHGSVKVRNAKFKDKNKNEDDDNDEDDDDEKENSIDIDSTKKVFRSVLSSHIKVLFDGIFSSSETKKTVIEKELEENHLYFSLLYSKNVGIRRWLKALKLFSMETIAVSFIAVFYHYQSPSLYNCYQHKSINRCTGIKSLLDPSKEVCQWENDICSKNINIHYYDHIAFIIILLCVMQAMGIINLFLDIAINDIILAPIYSEDDDIQRSIDRNELLSRCGKYVQERMSKMLTKMKNHRKYLLSKSNIDELQNFDNQWGITENFLSETNNNNNSSNSNSNSNSNTSQSIQKIKDDLEMNSSLPSPTKRRFNIRNKEKIARDMFDIEMSTQEYSFRLQDIQSAESSVLLLYIFVLDLLGRNSVFANIYSKKVDLYRLHKIKVPIAIKLFTFLLILGCDGVAIYFTSLIASEENRTWNIAVLICALGYLFLDLVIFETAKLFWIHLMIPSLIIPVIRNAENVILSLVDISSNTNLEEDQTFSASDYIFVSASTAKSFPEKLESALILSYRNPYPDNYWVTWNTNSWHYILSTDNIQSWESISNYQVNYNSFH